MPKKVDFYHEKGIDMPKLGVTLPNLANLCLHKSTSANICPSTESKDLLEEIRRDIIGGRSIVSKCLDNLAG